MAIEADYIRHTVVRDLGRGTAFPLTAAVPGGLLSGDRFFRTDRLWPCVYDGSRWLTQFELAQPLCFEGTIAGATALSMVRPDFAPYFTHIAAATTVAATNNGSNYWNVSVQTFNVAGTASDTILSFTTAADTAAVRTNHGATPTAVPGNNVHLRFAASATGAPGALTIVGTAYYRFIVT